MMDAIHASAVEPLIPQLGRVRPAADDRDARSPGDQVSLSPGALEAAEALPPVEESQDTTDTEDALHTAPDASEEEEDREKRGELSPKEQQLVSKLRARDMEVRAHEAAHIGASGGLAGGASYSYQSGPDGKRYAVGGEVKISSPRTSDPQQTLANAEKMRAAAMAPASPSGQDRAVAAQATAMISRARAAVAQERSEALEEVSSSEDVAGSSEETPDDVGAEVPEPIEAAKMGGPTMFGPALHLHSDGCGYCSASAASFLANQ